MKKDILLHPVYLGTLFMLLFNDFLLKSLFPGLITGKLSDVAGLIVLPLFLYSAAPAFFKTFQRKLFLILAVGVFFTLLQNQPFLSFINRTFQAVGLPSHTLTADESDLITVFILPMVLILMLRIEDRENKNKVCKAVSFRFAYLVVITATLFSLTATSYVGTKKVSVTKNLSSGSDVARTLFNLESVLLQNGYKIKNRSILSDTTYILTARLSKEFRRQINEHTDTTLSTDIDARIVLSVSNDTDSLYLSEITLRSYGYLPDTTAERDLKKILIHHK